MDVILNDRVIRAETISALERRRKQKNKKTLRKQEIKANFNVMEWGVLCLIPAWTAVILYCAYRIYTIA
jgi:hypothetical protein